MAVGFCGDSNTYGVGVSLLERYPHLVNCKGKVYARPGASNEEIFLQALESVANNDVTVIMWSAPGRTSFQPEYNVCMNTNGVHSSLNYLSTKKWRNFIDTYKLLDSDYNTYCQLEKYCSLLDNFGKVIHMNALVHVDPAFLHEESVDYSQLRERTKLLLDFENKDDVTLSLALKNIRNKFKNIQRSNWVEITKRMKIDIGTDGQHMGPKSHRQIANNLLDYCKQEGIDIG